MSLERAWMRFACVHCSAVQDFPATSLYAWMEPSKVWVAEHRTVCPEATFGTKLVWL